MKLAENLQRLRKERGLSQEEVAQKLYLTRQSVSKWENGGAEPGVDNLIALARLYGVTVDQLVGNCPEPEEELLPPVKGDQWGYTLLVILRLVSLFLIVVTYVEYCGHLDLKEIPLLDWVAMIVGVWVTSPVMWVILLCLEVACLLWSVLLLLSQGSVWAFCSILVHGACLLLVARPGTKARFRAEK